VLQLVRAANSHRRRLPQSFGHRRNSRSRARERWTMTAGTSTQTRRKPARWRSSTPARAGPKQRGKSASASRRCRSGFSGAEPSNIRAHFGPKRSRNQLWREATQRGGRSREVVRRGFAARFRLRTPWRCKSSHPHSRFRRVRLHRVGTTTRVKPSSLSMRTLSPVSAPSSQRAAQSSPLTRTCPLGWHGTTTSATCPIIASPPVCGRHRRASRRPQVSSTTSIPRPARTTIRFHGQGAKNSARTIARSSAIRES
jgi:hypothetical protein